MGPPEPSSTWEARARLEGPTSPRSLRKDVASWVEVEGRGPGLRRRWAGGEGRSQHPAWDLSESSKGFVLFSPPASLAPGPKGALALSTSLVNGWMNEGQRGWGRGGGSG